MIGGGWGNFSIPYYHPPRVGISTTGTRPSLMRALGPIPVESSSARDADRVALSGAGGRAEVDSLDKWRARVGPGPALARLKGGCSG